MPYFPATTKGTDAQRRRKNKVFAFVYASGLTIRMKDERNDVPKSCADSWVILRKWL